MHKGVHHPKEHLVSAPVLAYPRFDHNSSEFNFQTYASSIGLGAVLEQDGHVITYASRSLTQPERQYSVIQRESLATVYALKQFHHYLLGCHFQLFTDHALLQWLSAQKMEGVLCRWALAIQEFSFQIVYRKGFLNTNADALSCVKSLPCSVTLLLPNHSNTELQAAQQADRPPKVLQALSQASSPLRNQEWRQYPLRRYVQMWGQL